MQPTLESRPDLELNNAVRAFSPTGDLSQSRLDEQALDLVVSAGSVDETRAIVVDLGKASYVSANTMGDLVTLHRQLSRARCQLLVLAENPTLRELFIGAALNRYFIITGSRAELSERLELVTHPPEDVTEQELDAVLAENLTIEDVLREGNL